MQKIIEVPIQSRGQYIHLPVGAKIMCVQPGNNSNGVLWCIVNDRETELEQRTIMVYKNDCTLIEGEHVYIGTVHLNSAVYHVFEIVK